MRTDGRPYTLQLRESASATRAADDVFQACVPNANGQRRLTFVQRGAPPPSPRTGTCRPPLGSGSLWLVHLTISTLRSVVRWWQPNARSIKLASRALASPLLVVGLSVLKCSTLQHCTSGSLRSTPPSLMLRNRHACARRLQRSTAMELRLLCQPLARTPCHIPCPPTLPVSNLRERLHLKRSVCGGFAPWWSRRRDGCSGRLAPGTSQESKSRASPTPLELFLGVSSGLARWRLRLPPLQPAAAPAHRPRRQSSHALL